MLHLAEMADGGLARIRTPGGRLTAVQASAVADLAERLGSGAIDLTNRANLQIRGLPLDAGAALAEGLSAAGLFVDGPADRRRNILLDPLAGLDPTESVDLRPLSDELDRGLMAAPWIADLSPKFSFVLDGGGRSGISATASDVSFRAVGRTPSSGSARRDETVAVALAGKPLRIAVSSARLVEVALAIARMAADVGPDARGRDLAPDAVVGSLPAGEAAKPAEPERWPSAVAPAYGIVATADPTRVAVVVPVAVGRIDPAALRWLAGAAERHGDGTLFLAPWSAVVVPGAPADAARALLDASERAGFPPVAVARRLMVVACSGAPSCIRASEPAKAIGRALLAAAADRPELLPPTPRSVHVSACAKGCAGSAPADLLLLGATEEGGFSLHANAAPRRPGRTIGRVTSVDPLDVLAQLQGSD